MLPRRIETGGQLSLGESCHADFKHLIYVCTDNMRWYMHPIILTAALIGVVLTSSAAFAEVDACTLITQAQVGAALEIPVGAGTPIGRPSSCQWAGKGRFTTLVIIQPRGGKSPVESFNAGKASTMPGIITESVSGVGDEAYYVYFNTKERSGLGLVVKKGTTAFEIRVYGFELDKAKSVAKTLCQTVAGKI